MSHKTFPKPAPKPPARRRRMAARSEKRQAFEDELTEVRPLVEARSRCVCECGCGRAAEAIHHRLRRSQGGTNELENLAHLAHVCHRRVHANPAESYANGMLLRRA